MEEFATLFKNRGSSIERRTQYILFVIGLLIFFGLMLFFMAPQFAAQDQLQEVTDRIESLRENVKIKRNENRNARRILESTIKHALSQYMVQAPDKRTVRSAEKDPSLGLREFLTEIKNMGAKPNDLISVQISKKAYYFVYDVKSGASSAWSLQNALNDPRVDENEKILRTNMIHIEGSKIAIDELEKRKYNLSALKSQSGGKIDKNIDLTIVVQTGILRFGAVVIVILLVTILVSIYRYNVRLYAFYYAVADALKHVDPKTNQAGFVATLTALTPPMEFGKGDISGFSDVPELLKELLKAAKKTDSN